MTTEMMRTVFWKRHFTFVWGLALTYFYFMREPLSYYWSYHYKDSFRTRYFMFQSGFSSNDCRTPVVRPRRGKVVLLLVVLAVLGAVRSNSENCLNIHFRRFTDPHKIQIPKAHDAYYPMTPPWWQWQRHTQRQRQRQRQNFQEESLPVYISFPTKCCNRYIYI